MTPKSSVLQGLNRDYADSFPHSVPTEWLPFQSNLLNINVLTKNFQNTTNPTPSVIMANQLQDHLLTITLPTQRSLCSGDLNNNHGEFFPVSTLDNLPFQDCLLSITLLHDPKVKNCLKSSFQEQSTLPKWNSSKLFISRPPYLPQENRKLSILFPMLLSYMCQETMYLLVAMYAN